MADKRDRNDAPPSYPARLLAVVLLVAVAPFLLFAGYIGIKFQSFAFILLPAFGIVAFVAYKGARALWFAHRPPRSEGWAIVFVVLDVLLFFFYAWLYTGKLVAL